jgi:hypothetical protein
MKAISQPFANGTWEYNLIIVMCTMHYGLEFI